MRPVCAMLFVFLATSSATDFSITNNGEDTILFCYGDNCTVAAYAPRVMNGRTSVSLAVYECHSVLRVYYDCASLTGASDECNFVQHLLTTSPC